MYQSLQASRAAAAGLVVLFHLGGTFAQDKYFGFKALDGPFAWADAGVEFFFVLSGFLITAAHSRDFGQPQALVPYLLKRALRIYPTYWLICAAVAVGALAVPTFRALLPTDLLTLAKTLALVPQDPNVVGGTGAPILFVAWSMQYEVLFYGVFALFIASRAAGLAAVAGIVFIQAGCRLGDGCGFPLTFLASNLLFLFAMGVASAVLVRSRLRVPMPLLVAVAGIVAFVAFGAYEVTHQRDPFGLDRRLVYGVFSAAIIVGLARAEAAGTLVMQQRWVAQLGDSSYSLYLLHIPVISLLCKLFVALGISAPAAIVATFFGIFAACVGISFVFYMLIERPMLRWFRTRFSRALQRRESAAPGAPAAPERRDEPPGPARQHRAH